MRHLIIIVFILFSSFSFAQENKIKNNEMTCETATEKALQDANNGIYKYITYGMVASSDWDFDKFYWAYVKDKYNVILGAGGCIVTPEIVCYNRKMKELIHDKFGNDFFEEAKREANVLYKQKSSK